MRVITGIARGRKLKEVPGMRVRPTSDLVKEALFNIIQFDIEGRKVLDLFAGTGQLGIEALSRGAKEVCFVDEQNASMKVVRENLAHCKLEGKMVVENALQFIAHCGTFDLIFIDPPYDTSLCEKALQKICEFDILSIGGIIVCETRWETEMPVLSAPYQKQKEYKYGKVKLTVYTKEA